MTHKVVKDKVVKDALVGVLLEVFAAQLNSDHFLIREPRSKTALLANSDQSSNALETPHTNRTPNNKHV